MLKDLELTTPPNEGVVDLPTTKLFLRVDSEDEDALIEIHIEAAIGRLDGYSGELGRALVTQTWTYRLDSFPAGGEAIAIPLPPLISVDEVKYLDTDGTELELDPSTYRVRPGAIAKLRPAIGEDWPETYDEAGCVSIVFTCGFGDAAAVPAKIRQAILLMVGDLYANREVYVVAAGGVDGMLNPTVERLIAGYRLPRT